MKSPSLTPALAFGLLLGVGALAHADELPRGFTIDDANPEASVPDPKTALTNPLAMGQLVIELARRAEQSARENQPAQAARYYLALAKAAPERATAFSMACAHFEQAGQLGQALDACRNALGRPGASAQDSAAFVRIVTKLPQRPTGTLLDDTEAVIRHVRSESATHPELTRAAAALDCQLAVRLSDQSRLVRCTEELERLAPDAAETIAFSSALALARGDAELARKALARAERAQLPAPTLALMKQRLAGIQQHAAAAPSTMRWWPVLAVLSLAALVFTIWRRQRPQTRSV